MSGLPPMFGESPGGECSRWLGDRHCGRLAATHILWTSDMENGICCVEHDAEVTERWCFYARHPWQPSCSAPNAIYLHELNRCIVPEDLEALERTFAEVKSLPEGAEALT